MPQLNLNIKRMHADIKSDFKQLDEVKEFGVRKYRKDYILARLANKYYRSPITIENIVFNRCNVKRSH